MFFFVSPSYARLPSRHPEDNGGHEGAVVALAIGQSAAEGALAEYIISASADGTMGVFQAADGTLTYKHKCGAGVSTIAAFDPTPGTSALMLVGYEVMQQIRLTRDAIFSCFFFKRCFRRVFSLPAARIPTAETVSLVCVLRSQRQRSKYIRPPTRHVILFTFPHFPDLHHNLATGHTETAGTKCVVCDKQR